MHQRKHISHCVIKKKNCDVFVQFGFMFMWGVGSYSFADLWEFADTTLRGWIANVLAAGKPVPRLLNTPTDAALKHTNKASRLLALKQRKKNPRKT